MSWTNENKLDKQLLALFKAFVKYRNKIEEVGVEDHMENFILSIKDRLPELIVNKRR